jgi:hypothetical protein
VSKVFAGDRLVKDLKVYYPIKGQGRENRIFSPSKEEFIPARAFTAYRPRVRPPQHKLVEVAFVRKNQLLWAEVSTDERHEFLTVPLVSLEAVPCDLQKT